MFAEATQYGIDSVKQVGTHHRYFVDDEQVAGGNDFPLFLAEVKLALDLCTWHVRREWQLKERVNGDATRIDSRHTRRRYDDGSLTRVFHDGFQECRLSRSCFASKKYAAPRALDEVPCRAQLAVLLHSHNCLKCKGTKNP